MTKRMKPDSWMPLYIGDWLKDTQHLDATTNGAYWFLIMAHWGKHGVSSDDEHLRQIARVREIDWARVKGTLQPFFVELDGLWINRRCVEEYESATSAYRRNCERTAAANAARNDERNVSRNGDVTSYVTKHVNPPSTYHVNPPLTSRQSQSQSQSQPQPHINNELGGIALTKAGKRTMELVRLCEDVLGKVEMAANRGRWVDRAMKSPDRLERVLAEVKGMKLEHKIKTTAARAAEDLLKRFKTA